MKIVGAETDLRDYRKNSNVSNFTL